MTIIKTKKTKEIIDNIKKEQQENRLNWEQKVDDWEERHILQSELLNQVEKDLEQKVLELEVSKEEEKITRETYVDLLTKKDEKIRMLEEKDESQQISLLKKQHEKEIVKLERSKRTMEDSYYRSICDNLKDADTIKELEKELEEKELLIEQLEQEKEFWRITADTHLLAIAKGQEWGLKRENKKLCGLNLVRNSQIEHQQRIIDDKSNEIESLKQKLNEISSTKKLNKVKMLKNKITNKFHQLQLQKQKMIARIEVKLNK